MSVRFAVYLASFLILSIACSAVRAVNPRPEVVTAAGLRGPERSARLLALAKEEGALNLYATMGQEQISAVASLFEKKYGIKVNLWRASSEVVARRAHQLCCPCCE